MSSNLIFSLQQALLVDTCLTVGNKVWMEHGNDVRVGNEHLSHP